MVVGQHSTHVIYIQEGVKSSIIADATTNMSGINIPPNWPGKKKGVTWESLGVEEHLYVRAWFLLKERAIEPFKDMTWEQFQDSLPQYHDQLTSAMKQLAITK